MHRIIFVAPVAFLFACSGSDGSIVAGPSATDAGSSENAAPPTSSAHAPPASTSVPDGGPAHVDPQSIDPIAVGNTWTYDVTVLGTYPICKPGSHSGQVLGSKQVMGKQAFQVQSFCPGAGTSSYAVEGDRVEVLYGGTWLLALDAPVEQGHTWSNGTTMYVWEKSEQVTGEAGTFDDCWTARQKDGASYTTFCRGVGPVRWHYVDGGGNGYDAVLTAKNF